MMVKSKEYSMRHMMIAALVLLSFNMCFTATSMAQGDLLIFPKRVVFDGKKKVEKLILSNTDRDTSVYSISFIQRRMNESGKLERITEADSGQLFATPYLRVFPRRVILAPGESQIVKIQVSRSGTIEDGEYRSHLLFMPEKQPNPLGTESLEGDSAQVSVKLEAVFGISIPVIIRKGASTTVCSISEISYTRENGIDILSFEINRQGNMSIFGDISIYFTTTSNKSYEVASVKRIAVYTPGMVRRVKMQVQKPDGVDFTKGTFKVVYAENESKKIIAEAELR